MKNITLFLLLSLLSLNLFSQKNLPKGMTEYEKLIWDDYVKNYPTNKGTAPPENLPRTPAEWEEMQGVIVTWAQYTSNLREIVRQAKDYVKVYIVCSSPASVQNYLTNGGVSINNIEFIEANYNSVWVRDYGPQSIYLTGTNELAFVDWVYNRPRPYDDIIPSVMANHLDIPIYQMTQSPNILTATGGNFMTDGFHNGFSSKLILTENNTLTESQIDNIKNSYMGIDPYIKMTVLPYDGIHHIDMHMKLLDEETLLVGEYPEGVSDGPQIEENLKYILDNYLTPYGKPYRVVRIPMPPDEYGEYPIQYSDYLTYTNAIILNGLVLVPTYNLPQDEEALEIYRNAMPGYNIVGINMRNVIPASGAIHCITREIAAFDPIFISHPPVRGNTLYSDTGYSIDAHITSASGIAEASLFWSTDTTAGFNQTSMVLEQDTFRALIPTFDIGTTIHYYVSASNGNNKTLTKPLVAPKGLYTFNIKDNTAVTYNLLISVEGNGNTSPTPGNHNFEEGTTVALTATPNNGWEFSHWEVTTSETNFDTPEIEIEINEETTATAHFTEIGSTISYQKDNRLIVFPNPGMNIITLSFPHTYLENEIIINDIAGNKVLRKTIVSGENEVQIDISLLQKGVYVIGMKSNNNSWSAKFIKL